MGASFLWNQIAGIGSNTLAIMDEEKTDLYLPQIMFNYRCRNIGAEFFQFPFFRLWPVGRFMGGDPVNGVPYLIGQDGSDGAAFEPWSVFAGGSFRPGYIQGKCTMSDGATALAAAVVNLYLSSNDALVSSGITDQNGNYSLPTPYLGQNHFIWANYASGTYVGASADTLVPNF